VVSDTGVRERRPQRRAPDILSAAARLFATEGFHGTSMRDLARATGLQAGSLYSHFSGKDELLRRVVAVCLDALEPRLVAVARGPGEGSERLEGLIAATVDTALDRPEAFLTLSNHARLIHASPDFAELSARVDSMRALWQAVVAEGIADGTFRADLPDGAVLWFVFSAITGVVDGRYGGAPGEVFDVIGALQVTLLDGIRIR
jgi:AcrR family transcriptional regulator